MAKEQWHNWGRYILLAIVIIFASGGWVAKVISNSRSIEIVESKAEENEDGIHLLELKNKDLENLSTATFETLEDIKETVKKTNEQQVEIRLNITKINTQLQQWEPQK